MIFWILTSSCLGIDYWLLLPQELIQSLLYCLNNTEEKMLVSQIE